MKLAHLADIHLGFRQFHRLTRNGINQREADVARAFRGAIDGLIAERPDIVVVAGDLFHSVRPSNTAILDSFNQFRRLRAALPETPLVLVAGNHDTPRSIETGTILRLFEAVGDVHVVADEPAELVFRGLDLSVLCVPHLSWRGESRPTLTPSADAKYRVAVTHGVVAGVLPEASWAEEYGAAMLEPSDLHAERWSYVALGHYHVTHRVSPNAWYAGALEYVTANPWGELRDEAREGRKGKGWLLVELAPTGPPRVTIRPVEAQRRLIDLPAIAGAGLGAEELNELIVSAAEGIPGGLGDQIVRQVVYDVPRPVARDLDHGRIRDFKARALHFHLDLRRPAPTRAVGVGSPGERQTLAQMVKEYVSRRPLDADIDRKDLVALAAQYMDLVQQLEDEG